MIKLVAFDWNGTMIADTKACLHADNVVLKHFNLEEISLKRMQETFDIPISKFWENLGYTPSFFETNATTIGNLFMEDYLSHVRTVRTRSGITKVLSWLSSNHIQSVIFSNHLESDIHSHIQRLKIQSHIQAVMARSSNDTSQLHKRSKEQKLKDYLTQAGIEPRSAITVGDTLEEIQIGKNLGLHTVAILGGQCTKARLAKLSPDFIIKNAFELKKIIEELNAITSKN